MINWNLVIKIDILDALKGAQSTCEQRSQERSQSDEVFLGFNEESPVVGSVLQIA